MLYKAEGSEALLCLGDIHELKGRFGLGQEVYHGADEGHEGGWFF